MTCWRIGTRKVSLNFRKQEGSSMLFRVVSVFRAVSVFQVVSMFRGSFGDSGSVGDRVSCVCVCGVIDWLRNAKSLAVGLNNCKVIDLTLLRNSRLSLTIARINLLLEELFEPYVKYGCSVAIYGEWHCPLEAAMWSGIWSVLLEWNSMRLAW